MEGGRQLRLLLWRDYLIRKRNFITLAGVLWASGIMFGIYTVRMNIDNEDFPTCQFPARALPSAGIVPFLQSFVCSANNECAPMDQFEEIPAYNESKLTKLQKKVAPLLNDSVLEMASSLPSAVKLLATVADVADEPTFMDFANNGLKVSDLFNNPKRVKRYVTSQLELDDDVAQSLMSSQISIQGIANMKPKSNCTSEKVLEILTMENPEHSAMIAKKLCSLNDRELETMMIDLLHEMNLSKYVKMLGNMYFKMSGDTSIIKLGDFITALLRMTKVHNLMPAELYGLWFGKQPEFSYMNMDVIQKFIDLFEPTFGDTEEFKTVREIGDLLVGGAQYLNNVFGNINSNDTTAEITSLIAAKYQSKMDLESDLKKIGTVFKNAMMESNPVNATNNPIDPFAILSKLLNIIYKFLPASDKGDVLFYSTLLTKLIESADKVIYINTHLEELAYNVTLRSPKAVDVLVKLPPHIIVKGIQALTNTERTQILTSNSESPRKVFCDVKKIENLFLINKTEAEEVKTQLCNDAWIIYVKDLTVSFGFYDVKSSINQMASLFIQKTLGQDVSSNLYTLEHDVSVLKRFTLALLSMGSKKKPNFQWAKLLKVEKDSEIMKTFDEMSPLKNSILITVHGTVAKEIVSQNKILELKINPILKDTSIVLGAILEQLGTADAELSRNLKYIYGDAIRTMLLTALDEEKTYKCLSTYSIEIFCEGSDVSSTYLAIPANVDAELLTSTLCQSSLAIEAGLKNDSILSTKVLKMVSSPNAAPLNWTLLVNNIQNLFIKLSTDYPYLFEYSTYNMSIEAQQYNKKLYDAALKYWFNLDHLQRGLHLSVKLGFRLLDFLDHGIFNLKNERWLKLKHVTNSALGPLLVIDDTIKLVTDLLVHKPRSSSKLPFRTADALTNILPNLGQLIVDSIDLIVNDTTDISPIISIMNANPPWPCSDRTLAELLTLTEPSIDAILGIETLLCMNKDIQEEWKDYFDARDIKIKNIFSNTTEYDPHLFLRMSSVFDSMINDTVRIKETLQYIQNENKTSNHTELITAWKYAVKALNSTDGDGKLRIFFHKLDSVLNAIDTPVVSNMTTNNLWESYIKCMNDSFYNECQQIGRAAWKYSLQTLSLILENIANDLLTYFKEVNEPNASPLQVLGFTKSTPLYMLFEKLPEFISVLINSYWDFGFMSQIRRAALTRFWDCDAVMSSLSPALGSVIQRENIEKVKPYLCPSFLYWISLPRGDNVFFDIVAKPQYYIYTLPVQNSTSNYENAYTKATALTNRLGDIAKENNTKLTDKINRNSVQEKFNNFLDKLVEFKIDKNNPSYIKFNEMFRKQFTMNIYLTRIVSVTNKLAEAFNELVFDNSDNKLNSEIGIIKNMFRRKAADVTALHFDIITDLLWKNDSNYTIVKAVEAMCNNIDRSIVLDETRIKSQICAKNYEMFYVPMQGIIDNELTELRNSLVNLVNIMKRNDSDHVIDIFEFMNERKQLVHSLRHSVKFAYDLGLPLYLKYLQTNIQSQRILIAFLSGGDWWTKMTEVYDGKHSKQFFEIIEQTFEVVDNILFNLDEIHLVRLIRDLNVNESDAFCRLDVSDYIPDSTTMIQSLTRQICDVDKVELFKELPPLLYASQGYESALKVSKDVDYNGLSQDLSLMETQVELMGNGPKDPQRPGWITDEKIEIVVNDLKNILSKESLTSITFGIMKNFVDAGTLFLNSSHCTPCSQLTSWFKQLNLQVIKKQEYENLLCHIDTMSLKEIHRSLKNDFHWDMFIREIISSRNYTKYELNKSMNEFLGLVKVHFLEDLSAGTNKLAECMSHNITKNGFGNASVFISVAAYVTRLLRAEAPHLQDIDGFKKLPYLNKLYDQIGHNLEVKEPLQDYLVHNIDKHLIEIIKDFEVVMAIVNADLNLKAALMVPAENLENIVTLHRESWDNICSHYSCAKILEIIRGHIDFTKVRKDLTTRTEAEFWNLPFASSILYHIESFLLHTSRLLGVASNIDIKGVIQGRIENILDALITLFMDDNINGIVFSINGLINELKPLLNGTALSMDMGALSNGLQILHRFKNYLIEKQDLRLKVSDYFPSSDDVESGLTELGINNTNFWSIAAPRIADGYINLKPILTSKDHGISSFVCNIDLMAQVIQPGSLDVVTQDDVMTAVAEQFCKIDNKVAKKVVLVLFTNVKFVPVINKLKEVLLMKLYNASDLTPEQGSSVLRRIPRMTEMLPPLQNDLQDVMQLMKDEPIFKSLKDFSSVSSLMSTPDFMANAGKMMCGKPFRTDMSRIIQNVIKAKDQNVHVDQEQLDGLPTDFCRSMYKEIISMEGGKIVWSFVKPLIMGRILFTPQTPPVLRIIEKVNETFASMIRMTDLVHEFTGAFPSLDSISSHREGLEALQRMLSAPGMEMLKTQILGKGVDVNIDIEKMFDKVGDMKGMDVLLNQASSLLRCIRLDRLLGVPDEDTLLNNAAKLLMANEFSAGIVFLNTEKLNDSLNHVEYKIRMDIENAPTTVRMQSYLWIPGPESSFIENMRYFRGFVQIQDLVDNAIISLASRRSKRDVMEYDDSWTVYTQQMPYPCYRKDYFQTSLYESQALVVGFFFSMLFTVAAIVRFIVADKESGNTMLMSVMGVNLKYHTLSWFLTSFVEITITVACVTLILKWGLVLPRTDPTLIFALLFVYGLSVLSFCYLVSKLFSSASFAAVCAGILYLITFMPYVIIISLEAVMQSSLKVLVCLSMSSSLCYAFLYIMRFEAMGIGATWSLITDSPNHDDMNIAYAAMMMLFDAVVYFIIGWSIDRYFGLKTISSNIINCETDSEKAGVSIVGVTKIYGEGSRKEKVALDNVSIELHKGQITTLLGHNGAGKTTLIKILTGMLRPTRGHVVVRGAGRRAGVCPQHDVLVECLTAREHVALYAQIHGTINKHNLNEEVDRMLSCMSLSGVCDRPARCLSGGTRRRVCVALAFLARAHLVVLDEPTAGVDPTARREIWSMIVKMKQNRTILLTTHHLDEAEILSDQIVIMHKGQIHTTGSPIEIKRSLGTGYKLSITLNDKQEGDQSTQQVTEEILTTLQTVVPNARATDVCGRQVEISLPFYDQHGADNNMLDLCKKLEENESRLGVKSYSLDCSTLEQVFHDICQQADTENRVEYDPSAPETSKSSSTSSMKSDRPLVEGVGARRGSRKQQFKALINARYLHFIRNRWLMIMLIGLPFFFITVAMAFSTLRPPADNEISLPLTEQLYHGSTEFIVPYPSMDPYQMDPRFISSVMEQLQFGKSARNWTEKDTPNCKCTEVRQECSIDANATRNLPEMMVLPDVDTLNDWLVKSQEVYMQRRYGGFTSTIRNNKSYVIAWYNNKGHHALPAYLNAVNNAILRARAGDNHNITTYSHPMKISKEQISKDTVYQHIADAGVSALVLIALSLAGGGGAVPLVRSRTSKEKRLQYLSAVSPHLYWTAAIVWDLGIMFINMLLTAGVMMAFGFPVFVAKNNLPAICILIMLYGFACGSLVHLMEKLFSDASLANMMLFCGNAFCGLVGITILLILDIISESDTTDNVRWVLHKIFLLSPQFALGDGMLEVAKNTIQAQVLQRFGMDTYRDPLRSSLLLLHYSYLLLVGAVLFTANLALECGYFRWFGKIFESPVQVDYCDDEPEEVTAERRRVAASKNVDQPLSVSTIGNINRGFVHTEGSKNSVQRSVQGARDVAACEGLAKTYGGRCGRPHAALKALTLGLRPGQCLALLGENGAGKSTTFSLLTGEISPTAGNIYINGIERDARGLSRGLISYCPQGDAIDPLLTVKETLQLYCDLRGITDQNDVISRTIEMFDLCKYSEVRAGALSGGNKRKLCTAIAFMGRAPLVLLDEPTSGMDPVSRACVWRGVCAARGGGRGALLSTHALDDARRAADNVALLASGRLLALAPLTECLHRFGGGYVVQARCRSPRSVWGAVRARAAHASLTVLHHDTLHFLVPNRVTVEKKEVSTKLSDIFALMSELQATCDIEDYTVNHSSLEQMFLSFSDKAELNLDSMDLEPLPEIQKNSEHIHSITSL